jgi:hypothetical protein
LPSTPPILDRDNSLASQPLHPLSCNLQGERKEKMPEVYVHAIEGRTKEQKRALIKDITDSG